MRLDQPGGRSGVVSMVEEYETEDRHAAMRRYEDGNVQGFRTKKPSEESAIAMAIPTPTAASLQDDGSKCR